MQRRDVLMAGLAGIAAPAALPATAAPAAPAAVSPASPPVVLELFTSQGCSSCPPAEALLGRLVRAPGIIALAWHVDYWDGLGWRDPYSSADATQRQRRYAAALRDEVYTPALVVNGARMVVGLDEPAVLSAIGEVRGFAVPVTLRQDAELWVADIGTAGQAVSALAATYDPQHATQIAAGENGGRRLTDYRIWYAARPCSAPGTVRRAGCRCRRSPPALGWWC